MQTLKIVMKVIKFFDSYLASYLAAEESEQVAKIYQNIRRWRGGQLAINSAAGGYQFYSTSHRYNRIRHKDCIPSM